MFPLIPVILITLIILIQTITSQSSRRKARAALTTPRRMATIQITAALPARTTGADAKTGRRHDMAEAEFTTYYDFR